VAVFEWDDDTIGLDVCGTVNGVCCKAWFALFAVRNDGRPGGLESSDGVRDSSLSDGVDCLPCNLAAIPLAHRVDQVLWAGDAANGFSGDGRLGHRTYLSPPRLLRLELTVDRQAREVPVYSMRFV
jgi:hypothetical protein